ncbi:MAG TPA: hypothetical protein EYN54_04830 [Methylococcaceae bacterium]|nr:hypothetical protein [Methylococcaceae bacterium]
MSNSNALLAALTDKRINDVFEIVRRDRTGVLATISMEEPLRPYEGYKGSWIDSYSGADRVVVNGTIAAGVTTLVTDASSVLRVGTIMTIPSSGEVIYVSAVASTTSCTIERSVGGVAAASINDNEVLIIDSIARPENSIGEDDGIYQPETVENFFQTIDTQINMSRRSMATMTFGGTNDLNFQLEERMKQLAIKLDRMIINGQRFTTGTGDNLVSATGGFRFYNDLASVSVAGLKSDAAGAALTQAMINNLNESIVTEGGTTNTLAVGIAKARDIHAIISANYSSERLSDWTQDEGSIFQLPTDMPLIGNVNQIVIDTNLRDTEVMMYDSSKITVAPMAQGNGVDGGNWRTMDATAVGQDGNAARIIGDFMVKVRQSKSHMGLIHNLQA